MSGFLPIPLSVNGILAVPFSLLEPTISLFHGDRLFSVNPFSGLGISSLLAFLFPLAIS